MENIFILFFAKSTLCGKLLVFHSSFFIFQQKAIVLVLVTMATDFEHKLNCADDFCKPVKFQANPL